MYTMYVKSWRQLREGGQHWGKGTLQGSSKGAIHVRNGAARVCCVDYEHTW